MALRQGFGWLMVVGIVVGVAERAPIARAAAMSADTTAVLNLRLTVADELSPLTRRTLISEADAIWRDSRVHLRWIAASEDVTSGLTLRVLVVPRDVTPTGEGHRWTVGELLRFEDRRAIAVASIRSAQRILDESRQYRLIELPAARDQRLGLVLGRAVAHEIGHYLLGTNTHAPYGLMRARIDAREFADPRSSSFRLDRDAVAHLLALATHASIVPGGVDESFSYPGR